MMEEKTHLNEGSSLGAREEVMVVSGNHSKVSAAEEPLELAAKDTSPLKSCMRATGGEEAKQKIKESQLGHNSSNQGASQDKGMKRKSWEAPVHTVEIKDHTSSPIHERVAKEFGGSGSRPSDDTRTQDGENGEGESSKSKKRIKLKSSIISRIDHSDSAGRGSQSEVKGNELPKAERVLTGVNDEKSLRSTEEKKVNVNPVNDEVKKEGDTQERWKGKAHVHLGLDADMSRLSQSRRSRNGQNRTSGQRSKEFPREQFSGHEQRTRLEVRQSAGSVKERIRDDIVGRYDLKRGRDHESRSVDDSKKRRDMPQRSREVVNRAREHEVKHPARDSKLLIEDHGVSREDKRVPRDKGDRFRARGLQKEVLQDSRGTKEAFREEAKKHSDSRRHARDLRQSHELGNGDRADQRRVDALTKHRESRHVQVHHLSGNIDRRSTKDGFFKGNGVYRGHSVAHVHRPNNRGPAHGFDRSNRRDKQDLHGDVYRPGRRVERDTDTVRKPREIDQTGKRFVHRVRSVDEETDLLRGNPEDHRVGKESVDHTSRKVRETDRPQYTDVKGARHGVASQVSLTERVESGSSRRRSKVVALSHLHEQDVGGRTDQHGGKVTDACEEGEEQMGFQDHHKQTADMNDVRLLEAVEITQGEAGGSSAGVTKMAVESDFTPDRVKEEVLHQNKINPLSPPDSLKYPDKRKSRDRAEISEGSEKLRAKGAHSKERSLIQEVVEVRSSLEEQDKGDIKRGGAAKRKSLDSEIDVQEKTSTVGLTPSKSVDIVQSKPVKVLKEKRERSNESVLRRQSVKADKDRHDVSSHDHKYQKHQGSSHSVSPNTQKRLLSPKEQGKSTSPRRSDKDQGEWEKFQRHRNNTLAAFDSRYRHFGGGSSGLGGYSPRRRRSDTAIKTPSPPPRSPERRKPQTWDSIPPGMDNSMIAAMSAAHHAAVQQALATLATVAPLVSSSMLGLPVPTSSISSGLTTVPSMIPALPLQANSAVTAVTLTQATRPFRRLYVGNVPPTVSDGELLEFMNAAMLSANANHLPGTKPCINCSVNLEKSHAFAEFITPEDATAALAFDGVTLHGTTLKIRRPKDFVLPSIIAIVVQNGGTKIASPVLDMVSGIVADSPHKVFVGGIPSSITTNKVKEIVTAFGQLKAYHWEVDYNKQPPQAYAFLEYLDQTATLNACAGLNGMRLGTGFLTVVQATPDADPEISSIKAPFYGIPEHAKKLLEPPSRVLELHNLVSAEEASKLSKEDIEDLIEDVRLECTRFGNVKSTHMVHPCAYSELEIKKRPSLGKIEGAVKTITQNLEHKSVPNLFQAEVAEKDAEGELPKQQFETSKAISSSPVGSQLPGSFNANEEQMLATDAADHLSPDQLNEGNLEKINDTSDSTTNASHTVGSELANSIQGFGEHDKDQQQSTSISPSEAMIPSDGHELLGVPHQDLEGGPGRSSGSVNETLPSTSEWEMSHVGNVYVEFSREDAACQAAHYLHGRIFAGHKVAASYFPLKVYQKKFQKGFGPRTFEEKQALALAVQSHLTAHMKD